MQTITRITAAALLAWAVASAAPVQAEDGEVALVRLLQSNVELRGQVAELTTSVDAMRAELAALRKSIEAKPAVAAKPAPKPEQKTAFCQCQLGGGEGSCYCLKKGQQCLCPSKGPSEWNVTEAGAPISKTGNRMAKAAPPAAPQRQFLHVMPAQVMQQGCQNCQRSYGFDNDD